MLHVDRNWLTFVNFLIKGCSDTVSFMIHNNFKTTTDENTLFLVFEAVEHE